MLETSMTNGKEVCNLLQANPSALLTTNNTEVCACYRRKEKQLISAVHWLDVHSVEESEKK